MVPTCVEVFHLRREFKLSRQCVLDDCHLTCALCFFWDIALQTRLSFLLYFPFFDAAASICAKGCSVPTNLAAFEAQHTMPSSPWKHISVRSGPSWSGIGIERPLSVYALGVSSSKLPSMSTSCHGPRFQKRKYRTWRGCKRSLSHQYQELHKHLRVLTPVFGFNVVVATHFLPHHWTIHSLSYMASLCFLLDADVPLARILLHRVHHVSNRLYLMGLGYETWEPPLLRSHRGVWTQVPVRKHIGCGIPNCWRSEA